MNNINDACTTVETLLAAGALTGLTPTNRDAIARALLGQLNSPFSAFLCDRKRVARCLAQLASCHDSVLDIVLENGSRWGRHVHTGDAKPYSANSFSRLSKGVLDDVE